MMHIRSDINYIISFKPNTNNRNKLYGYGLKRK